MKEYCLKVTYKCNWDCSYCYVDTHSQPPIPFDIIERNMRSIEPGSEVSLSGGEPAFAKKDVIEYAFTELKKKDCRIVIDTNGAFFTRYPEYCSEVYKFFYHFSEDLDLSEDIHIPDPRFLVEYMLVITDKTFHRLGPFLDKYPDILFTVRGADPVIVKGTIGDTLSAKNGIKVLRMFKDRIHPESIVRLLEQCNNMCVVEDKMTILPT